MHIHHRRDYDEQKAVVVVKHHYQGYQLKAQCAIHESIWGLDSLYSSVAYNLGRLKSSKYAFDKFIYQTVHVVVRVRARAPWKFTDAPLWRRALLLTTTVLELDDTITNREARRNMASHGLTTVLSLVHPSTVSTGGLDPPKNVSSPPQIQLWNSKSVEFYQISECKSPLYKH